MTENNNIIDGLAQAARFKGRYARMLPIDRDPTSDEMQEASLFIRHWMETSICSLNKLSRMLGDGFSRATLSQVMNGSYTGDRAGKLRAVLSFIDNEELADDVVRPAQIVETEATKRMWALIGHTLAMRTIGVIIAPSGFSKTTVLKAKQQVTPGSIYVRINQTCTTPVAFIRMLARQLRVNASNGNDAMMAVLHVIEGSGRLLLIDEAHRLSTGALEVIRDLNDASLPVVLAGTNDLHMKIDDTDAGAQLYSRAAMIVDLNEFFMPHPKTGKKRHAHTVDEVIKICEGDELRFTGDARDLLFKIANTPGLGALRTCQLLIRVMAQIPSVRSKPITADQLWKAMEKLKGIAYQKLAEHAVDETTQLLKVG